MIHIRLFLIVFISTNVFAAEEDMRDACGAASIHLSIPHAEINRIIDGIYDPKKQTHRSAIVRKTALPVCLQDTEGPFPFYGALGDIQLSNLITDYFASLHFDDLEIQRKTEEMRLRARGIQRENPTEALKLLYQSGWKMGDPSSVQILIDLLVKLRNRGDLYLPENSNLISVLKSYPKTADDVLSLIRTSRNVVDRRERKSSSESFREEFDDDDEKSHSGDESSALLKTYGKGSGIRHRRKEGTA